MPEVTFQPIGVCVVLINDQRQVLLGKRMNSYKAGWFGIPGGRVEPGEALAACARRELTEETGVQAQEVEYLGVIKDFQNREYDFIHFIFVCRKWTGTVITAEPNKCEGWAWYDVAALPEPVLPAHAQALKLWDLPVSKRTAYVEM